MSKILAKAPEKSEKKIAKKKGHFGKGLIAGAIFGIAAGIFMSSREGKMMAKKLESRAKEIEKKLRVDLMKKKDLTQDAYGETIDSILAYYSKSKKIAKTEVPDLKRYLEDKWDLVRGELETVRAEQMLKTKKKTKTAKK
jgi:hypothetical protein